MQQPGKPSVLGKIIRIYLEESSYLLKAIHKAVMQENEEAVRDAAHSLKSGSVRLGAEQLAAVCSELEALAKEGRAETASFLLKRLNAEHENACSALRQELEALAEADSGLR